MEFNSKNDIMDSLVGGTCPCVLVRNARRLKPLSALPQYGIVEKKISATVHVLASKHMETAKKKNLLIQRNVGRPKHGFGEKHCYSAMPTPKARFWKKTRVYE